MIEKEIDVSKNFFRVSAKSFSKIPGSPIAYWVSEKCISAFNNASIGDIAEVITGMTIGDNNLYLRLWYEIDIRKSIFTAKKMIDIDLEKTYWIPYSKGGLRRNWYGNYEYLVNWSKNKYFNRAKTTLRHLYLKDAITWPFITSGMFSARVLPSGSLWDVAGSPCFFDDELKKYYALGFLCSKPCNYILKILNPTINAQAIDIAHLPYVETKDYYDKVLNLVTENIALSRDDWDSFETSWNFKCHPLVRLAKKKQEGR